MVVPKCEVQDEACAGEGERHADDAAEQGEHRAFSEYLRYLTRPRRAEGGLHGGMLAPARRSNQHQVGNVGAGNQQHEARNPHEQLQSGFISVAHRLHARSARREMQSLFRDQAGFTGLQLRIRPQQKLFE